MKALCWHGKGDVRVDTVPDPKIEDPRDAIVRITSTAICGSDLHLFDGYMPTMEKGDILGHEPMGDRRGGRQGRHEAEEGRPRRRPVHDLLRHLLVLQADRILALRHVEPERRGRPQGDGPVARPGLFGFSHMLGGYAGRPGRVPPRALRRRRARSRSSRTCPTRRSLFLSDIFPTGYMAAENAGIEKGDTVAVWGCGPVAQFAIQSAWMLGAGRVIAIDRVPERLEMARKHGKAETINFDEEKVYDTPDGDDQGHGARTAASTRSGARPTPAAASTRWSTRRRRRWAWPPTGRTSCARRSCAAARAARSRSPASTSGSWTRSPSAPLMNKGLTLKTGQTHVQRYGGPLLKKIEAGEIDPSFVITHQRPLADAPEMYKTFRDKKDGCIKVVLKP